MEKQQTMLKIFYNYSKFELLQVYIPKKGRGRENNVITTTAVKIMMISKCTAAQ